jgi:hypothetical protein
VAWTTTAPGTVGPVARRGPPAPKTINRRGIGFGIVGGLMSFFA